MTSIDSTGLWTMSDETARRTGWTNCLLIRAEYNTPKFSLCLWLVTESSKILRQVLLRYNEVQSKRKKILYNGCISPHIYHIWIWAWHMSEMWTVISYQSTTTWRLISSTYSFEKVLCPTDAPYLSYDVKEIPKISDVDNNTAHGLDLLW